MLDCRLENLFDELSLDVRPLRNHIQEEYVSDIVHYSEKFYVRNTYR